MFVVLLHNMNTLANHLLDLQLFNERIYIKAPRKPTSVGQSLAVNIPPSLLGPLVEIRLSMFTLLYPVPIQSLAFA